MIVMFIIVTVLRDRGEPSQPLLLLLLLVVVVVVVAVAVVSLLLP